MEDVNRCCFAFVIGSKNETFEKVTLSKLGDSPDKGKLFSNLNA